MLVLICVIRMSAHLQQKSVPLTKEEVMQLISLVHSNPVVYSRATNASNNQVKEATWLKITDSFNSLIGSCPRKPEQLRLKWENLKKAARKRSTKIRMNNLKTGGGKPEYIPPDEALDKVAGILGPTCDGYNVPFGGDALVVDVVDMEMVEEINDVPLEPVELPLENIPSPVAAPPSMPKHLHAQKSKFFFSSVASKGKLRRQSIADEVKASVSDRNRAIAEYYTSKRKNEEEIALLKKRRLELAIKQQEKYLD